ncbi:hypothetical protein F444_00442 [Phytophthora nicotianae P1976]|uniref:Uncharacterized protein n=1 Tax=Phytophthora nicotianae P1976 TaxID=1317066 RepID=A0A081B4A0_PHYNI|nr:hypothetical protein F444_00442 [Phytophthora nicotianae P1976]
MAPSLTSDAMNAIVSNEESMQSRSPPSSCGSDDDRQEETEYLEVADTELNDDNWIWLRDLLDAVCDVSVRSQAKVFFARLFKAQDAARMEATLTEMENWRSGLNESEHELARALFLLGYDKSMSLGK